MATKMKAKPRARKMASKASPREKAKPKRQDRKFHFDSTLEAHVYEFLRSNRDLKAIEYSAREAVPEASDEEVASRMADRLWEEVLEQVREGEFYTDEGLDLFHAADDAHFWNIAAGYIQLRKWGEEAYDLIMKN